MASLSKRMSLSSPRKGDHGPSRRSQSPLARLVVAPNTESEEWVRAWEDTLAQDLIEYPVVEVEANMTVEDACDLLLSKDMPCVAVKRSESMIASVSSHEPFCGLFDFADVNAFLTFAATRHTYSPEHLEKHPQVARIVEAAKTGKVPVHLVSNLSEKNPLVELTQDASVISLLGVFSSGAHRVLVKSTSIPTTYLGVISDQRLLAYFTSFARTRDPELTSPTPSPSVVTKNPGSPLPQTTSTSQAGVDTPSTGSSAPINIDTSSSRRLSAQSYTFSPQSGSSSTSSPGRSPYTHTSLYHHHHPSSTFLRYISTPLSSLTLPSLNNENGDEIVSVTAKDCVLDAMKKMSECGVSCVAVLDTPEGGAAGTGGLLSALSVTDVGKVVVPSQSNQILGMPLHMLISQIKMQMPDGWVDGADRYPVYSVSPSSTLAYTMQKLIATNTHRVFVTAESPTSVTPLDIETNLNSSNHPKGNLSGIVSIVDILSLFARIANIPDVDPGRMKRHRRASSVSSHGSGTSGSAPGSVSGSFVGNNDLVRSTSRGSIGGGRR